MKGKRIYRYSFMPDMFYERLQEAMNKANITIKELQRIMGVSNSTVYSWVNDERVMSVVCFMKLANALNVDPVWLYGEE